MSKEQQQNYWLFSNVWMRGDDDDMWGQTPILENKRYMLLEKQSNRKYIKPGDKVFMRVFGETLIGTFLIAGDWVVSPQEDWDGERVVGYFPMQDIDLWDTRIPFSYIQPLLSNQDQRSRIIGLDYNDTIKIETTKHLLRLLEMGEGDEQTLILLENGIEEAVMANLGKLKLRPADHKVVQQFTMGIGIGRSDLICLDENGDYVILEIKKDAASRDAVGQVMTYKGWIEANLAKPKQKVHAAIVASYFDQDIRYAAKAADIRLIRVRI